MSEAHTKDITVEDQPMSYQAGLPVAECRTILLFFGLSKAEAEIYPTQSHPSQFPPRSPFG